MLKLKTQLSFTCSNSTIGTLFTPFTSVSIIDFEQSLAQIGNDILSRIFFCSDQLISVGVIVNQTLKLKLTKISNFQQFYTNLQQIYDYVAIQEAKSKIS